MAVLSILDNQREDLKFLSSQPPQVIPDFCKLAWNFLTKGTNLKLYQTASQKLQVDVKQIQSGVEGLAYLFVEAGRNEATEEDFKEAVVGLGLPESLWSAIYSEYLNQKDILDSILPLAGVCHNRFKDLEWRFETKVSSKSLKNQIHPRVIIKLEVEKGGESQSLCLQSDIPNVIHMSQVISQALQDAATHHAKRIQRALA